MLYNTHLSVEDAVRIAHHLHVVVWEHDEYLTFDFIGLLYPVLVHAPYCPQVLWDMLSDTAVLRSVTV